MLSGNEIDKIPEESSPPARKSSCQTLSNGVVNKSNNELLYSHNNENGKTVSSEKTTRNNVKVTTASSPKKLNEDHNLNELENKSEQDGRLVNGHVGRSFNGGKRSSPLRVPNGDYEDSDSGDSSNTSTSSGPGGSKKENQNKTTQVRCGTSCYRSANKL